MKQFPQSLTARAFSVCTGLLVFGLSPTAGAQEKQAGHSARVPLQKLIASEEHTAKIERLKQARVSWQQSRKTNAARLESAKQRFESNPTPAAEAELVSANVEVIARQWDVLDEFVKAARTVDRDITAMIPQIGEAQTELDGAVDSLEGEIEVADAAAKKLVNGLRRVASQAGLDKKRSPGPSPFESESDLAEAVVEADEWIRLQEFRSAMAKAERQYTEGEQRTLDMAVDALTDFKCELRRQMLVARRKQKQLGMVAESQQRMLQRSIFTDAAVNRVRGLQDAGIDQIPAGEILVAKIRRAAPTEDLSLPTEGGSKTAREILAKWSASDGAQPPEENTAVQQARGKAGDGSGQSSVQVTSFQERVKE